MQAVVGLGHLASLWRYASGHARKANSKSSKEQTRETDRKVQSADSKAEGLLGKACKVISSSGIAPNTWNLLQQKHPRGQFLHTLKSRYLQKVSSCLQTLTSCPTLIPKDSACGPSGGRAPIRVAKFLAGGSLMALIKSDKGSPLDIRPIAVGEALRRLTGKCLCIITRVKASEFFGPFQLGVACPAGAEKLVHGLRRCISEHWEDDDFVACKIDLRNAFNEVSRLALLEECATHFPELFRRAALQTDIAGYLLRRVAMDLLGPLPLTVRSNSHIRVPDVLHTDQGRNFESTLMKEVYRLLGIVKTRTTPYHPQSDGLVERFNRTLLNLLSQAASENEQEWDLHILMVMLAYRTSVQESTGCTPFYLMFGREARLPADVMYGLPPSSNPIQVNHYALDLRLLLESAYQRVRELKNGTATSTAKGSI
ncbi:hypothetical protein EMCRGX_G015577 [Ephydatia muelleri]